MSIPQAVVDASVVLKWVLPEPGRAAAAELLDTYEAGGLDLLAPRLLLEEVASALTKHYRRRELSAADARQAFRWVESRRPALCPEEPASALSIALQHQLSFWDSMYLALAIRQRCDLITADQRLYRAAAKHYPFTRLLGAT